MRIGLSFAALVNSGGIGRYVRLLARGLPKFFPKNTYIGYVPSFREEKTRKIISKEGIEGWEIVSVPAENRWSFETGGLPKALKIDTPDIFHGPDYLAPNAPCPVCVTVHDLAFRLHPGGMAFKSRMLFMLLAPAAIGRAAIKGKVFCDSASTLNDLRKLRWVAQDAGIVVPLACEEELREPIPEDEMHFALDKRLLDPGFVLYVGPIERRKNLIVIAEAYRIVAQVLKRRDEPTPPLVAAGPLGAGGRRLLKKIEEASDGLFVHIGYLSRRDLRAFYQACAFFCYPSLYEGFGLPPLEAMYAGKAVAVSNASSLPEVVGDAGMMVDPNDVEGWSRAILRLLTDKNYRADREKASLEQSRKFSVEKMCGDVMEGYRDLLK